MDKFKNKEDIQIANSQIRGEVFERDDLDLIWIGSPFSEYLGENGKPYIIESFNDSLRNTVELTVFDMDNNQLFWEVISTPIRSYSGIQPNVVVLSPGDDLRNNEFSRGQYRIVYDFYRNILGSSSGNKLYVEEISPSRLEIRVRPVKTNDLENNSEFNNSFIEFSDNGITKQQFLNTITSGMESVTRNQLIQYRTHPAYNLLTDDKLLQLKETTIRIINNVLETYDKDSFNPQNQFSIFGNSIYKIIDEVFTETFTGRKFLWYMNFGVTRILTAWLGYLNSLVSVDNYSGNIDYYLNFGNGSTFPVTNWLRDDITYSSEPYSVVFKLYEPLPRDIKEKSQLWVSRQITQPVIEKVFMLGLEKEFEDGWVLRPANFDVDVEITSGRQTGYQNWGDLISTEPSTSQALLDHFISSSDAGDIQLNIDYSDYYNFIHFGSAAERLKNFKYKLELIESYEENIRRLNTYQKAVVVSASAGGFRTKIRQVKNGFDGYEKHLYYISGSSYSGSLKSEERYLFNSINEWPKKTSTKPYPLYEITSSEAVQWYSNQLAIAQRFDNDNLDSFRNNLPAYILIDVNNEDYLNFVYMIGQHFDTIYTYISQLTNIANRDESMFEGLAKDLTYHVASSHGFDLFNGNDNSELWRWAFGYNVTGSYYSGTVSGSGEDHLSHENVSKEIWRRILNNLPYLLKTKGTKRSIQALLACYGIPTSLLAIREYGGPDPRDYPNFEDKSSYIFEDFVYGIDFEGSQSISTSWNQLTQSIYPQTIEFRFASAPTIYAPSSSAGLGDGKPTQSLVSTTNWAINLLNSGSGLGFLEFIIDDGTTTWSTKTEKYRYYDNEFNSVMLRYTSSYFELWTKKAEGDHIIFHSSASLSASSAISGNFFTDDTLYIAGDAAYTWGHQFTGSMQEFKYYQVPLTERTWNNHVRWPKSYNSNDEQRTWYDLSLRYSFDDPKNHSVDSIVSDVKANQTYTTPGTANNFSSEINYTPRTEEFSALTPNIGFRRFINNKVRIEGNELIGNLNPRKRVELSDFDRVPTDSAKLGIYFSPLDSINRDIIATFAGIDLLEKIGDPRDFYEDSYRDLKELHWEYWKKYKNRPQFNDFIRTIRQFDQSFFKQIKSLLPARSKPLLGTLIEPNILERYKIEHNRSSYERNDYESNAINVEHQLTQSWEYIKTEGLLNVLSFEIGDNSDYIYYEGIANLGLFRSSSLYAGEQKSFIPVIRPIQEVQTGSFTLRKVYNEISSSVDASGTTFTRVVTSRYYEVHDLNKDNWLLGYRDLQSRLWYDGTLNTINTTFDGKLPVEVTFTNPNKLKVTDSGPSKIDVE